MIKRLLSIQVLLFLLFMEVSAQVTETSGTPIAEIFTDFHYNISDTARHTGFDLNRAYLGYQFLPAGNLSAKIIFNIGSPEDLPEGSLSRRYAFCREASLTWSNNKLSISMGITGTRMFEYQQNFLGKRYIASTYQSINGYGFVADIGIAMDYCFNDHIKADFTLMNGEGYCNLQKDDNIRSSLGFTITPSENLFIRIYGDIQRQEGLWQPLFIAFAGFKNSQFTIGGEVSYKSNIDLVRGHHVWGLSGTGGINITKKTEVFCRYDFISSVVMADDVLKWNYLKDGSFAIFGIQYTFSQYVKIALDYQGRYPYVTSGMDMELIYLNAMFKF